jgi:hypothetical protein
MNPPTAKRAIKMTKEQKIEIDKRRELEDKYRELFRKSWLEYEYWLDSGGINSDALIDLVPFIEKHGFGTIDLIGRSIRLKR